THSEFLFQTYLGSYFNLLLVTDHIPLSEVPQSVVTSKRLPSALRMALDLHKKFKMKKKIAVLGLNPHAGEDGLIGHEDEFVGRQIDHLDPNRKWFVGPIPADSAFTDANFKKFGLYVALYHDQGLIPFKALHGFKEGVHLTSGIPFVRTSVDHGTAKSIFGKGMAEPGSMIHALKTAMILMR